MSRQVLFNGATLTRPGAYTKIDASQFEAINLGGNGIVALVGEAEGGVPRTIQAFSGNPAAVQGAFRSGNLVEAANILADPGNDERIPAGAQQIVCYKINNSLRASLTKTPHIFKHRDYGLQTNMATMALAAGTTVNERVLTVTYIDALGEEKVEISPSLGGTAKFTMKYVGAGSTCAVTISATQLTTSVTGGPGGENLAIIFADYRSLQEIIAYINGLAAYEATALVSNVGSFDPSYLDALSAIEVKAQTGAAASIVGGAAPEQARLTGLTGMTAAMVGQFITISGAASPANNGTFRISVYTSATSVDIYNASAVVPDGSNGAIAWDAGPRYVYATNFDLLDWVNKNSSIVEDDVAAYTKGAAGPIATFTQTSLAGGTKGTASVQDWTTAFTALSTMRINQIVPLVSVDLDVLVSGSPNGTERAAVLAALTAHCKLMSGTAGRSERQGWMGISATKTALKAAALAQNSAHVCLTGQKLQRLRVATSQIEFLPEWSSAVALAGMRAGAPLNEPLTHKFVNCSGVSQDASWSNENGDDISDLLMNGVIPIVTVRGQGFRVEKGITTYMKSENDAYIEEIIVQEWKLYSYDLRKALEARHTGRPGTLDAASSVPATVAAVSEPMEHVHKIITATRDSSGKVTKAYRDVTYNMSGDQLAVGVTITPTPGTNFILITVGLVPARISS